MVSTRSSQTIESLSTPLPAAHSSPSPSSATFARSGPRTRTAAPGAKMAPSYPTTFRHVPTTTTLVWLAVSLPLVAWDMGYVFGRPYTMPGGAWHRPLWSPYALYGEVDHVYGFKAWHGGVGFTAAQSLLNLVETAMYAGYVWLWWAHAAAQGKGAALAGPQRAAVTGRWAALAVLIGFSAAVMTLSKTVLYWANEYYSAFDNIGHNSVFDLILLWIIPNGLWLVFPTYMIYQLGNELLDALAGTSSSSAAAKED